MTKLVNNKKGLLVGILASGYYHPPFGKLEKEGKFLWGVGKLPAFSLGMLITQASKRLWKKNSWL